MHSLWHANTGTGIERDAALGNTHTPRVVARQLVIDMVAHNVFFTGRGRFLEPCVGVGAFFLEVLNLALAKGLDIEQTLARMDAWDIDPRALDVFLQNLQSWLVEHNLPKQWAQLAHVAQGDFVQASIDHRYVLIATNPPYVADRAMTDPTGVLSRQALRAVYKTMVPDAPPRSDLYMVFLLKSLDLLEDHGSCLFLCSDSWLDSGFGSALRSRVSATGAYSLTEIRTWRMHSAFRDDTSAVATLIVRTPNLDTIVGLSDDFPHHHQAWTEHPVSSASLQQTFDLGGADGRMRLVRLGPDWDQGVAWEQAMGDRLVAFDQVFGIHTSSVSMADLQRSGILDPQGDTKIFWQLQARTNRPADYRHFPDPAALLCAHAADLAATGAPIRTNVLWMSSIIDRFPLFFHIPGPQAQVSKYLALTLSTDPLLALALLTSWPALYSMELHLKEGTRKTLRSGSHGLTKEIRVSDLYRVKLPNPTLFSDPDSLIALVRRFGQKCVFRLEDAILDPDWQAMQTLIADQLGIAQPEILARHTLALYWRRMRHTVQLAALDQAEPLPRHE